MDASGTTRSTLSRRSLLRSAAVVGAIATVGTTATARSAHATLDGRAITSLKLADGGLNQFWISEVGSAWHAAPFSPSDPLSLSAAGLGGRSDLTGRLTVQQRPDRALQVFVKNNVGVIYANIKPQSTVRWAGFTALGEGFSSSPVSTVDANGRIRLFALDSRRHIRTTSQAAANGPFAETWVDLGPNPYGELGAESLVAVPSGDAIWLVGHDSEGEQFAAVPFRNGEPGVWTALNGVYPPQQPAVVRRATGTLQLTMRTAQGEVRTQLLGADGSQSSPRTLPGIAAFGSISAAVVGDGRVVHITARDMSRNLHATRETSPGVFGPWARINGTVVVESDPSTATWTTSETITAFHDIDEQAHLRRVNASS